MTAGISPRYSVKYFRPGCYRVIKFKRDLSYRVPVRRGEGVGNDDEKFMQSLSRSKRVVLEVALCNSWDYFFTGTLDERKVGDRHDISVWRRIAQFFRDFNKLNNCSIKYLIIPERHEDGAWHFHGFLSGVPSRFLFRFVPGIHPWDLIKGGYLNFSAYARRFGHCSLGSIRSDRGVAFYITKYIFKDNARNVSELGAHLYYCSLGLRRAVPLGYAYDVNSYFDSVASYDGPFCNTGFVFDGTWDQFIPYLVGPCDDLPPLDWEAEIPVFTNTIQEEFEQLNIAGWCNGNIGLL